jgi:hypothetical protein
MHVNRAPYNTLLPDTAFLSATVLTICAGAIIFILGFCGCCGAILESQCMLVVVCIVFLQDFENVIDFNGVSTKLGINKFNSPLDYDNTVFICR